MRILITLVAMAAVTAADVVMTESESVQCSAISIDAKYVNALVAGAGVRLFPIGEVRQILPDDARRADELAKNLKGTSIVVGIVGANETPAPSETRMQPASLAQESPTAAAPTQGVLPAQGAVFTPVYLVSERNPGEAALYSLIGLPGIVPLGQLYNGELSKAGGILAWKLASLAAVGLGYALASKGSGSTPIPDEAYIPVFLGAGLYVVASFYSVGDAAVSAERINRRVREAHPELMLGWAIGF